VAWSHVILILADKIINIMKFFDYLIKLTERAFWAEDPGLAGREGETASRDG
jgi:hypothetical protein